MARLAPEKTFRYRPALSLSNGQQRKVTNELSGNDMGNRAALHQRRTEAGSADAGKPQQRLHRPVQPLPQAAGAGVRDGRINPQGSPARPTRCWLLDHHPQVDGGRVLTQPVQTQRGGSESD